jgi:phytoene desaturase
LPQKVIIIGAGFAGLAASAELAAKGYEVEVYEKNTMAGGRAQVFHEKGFVFDMGPSWYWMPEVFEDFFKRFGASASNFYELVRLDPSYQVIFSDSTEQVPAQMPAFEAFVEKLEPGASAPLKKFLAQAKYKYAVGMGEFVWKPSLSIREFFDFRLITKALQIDMFTSMSRHLRRFFKQPKLLKILEFPVLFLGSTPQKTPALYSLMNYADIALGTWYPMGGMHQIAKAMQQVAISKGVKFSFNAEVTKIETNNGQAKGVWINGTLHPADVVIAAADYQHVDAQLLGQKANYTPKYWNSRKLAPSSLLFYLGVNSKVQKLLHHNLFFDEDFDAHAQQIYANPQWPDKPLFYVCAPSKTDASVAPKGSENLFLLMPIATDLEDSEATRDQYYTLLMDRLEKFCGQPIKEHVVYKRSFAVSDFKETYHSFRGNAYGLANTLTQTAFLKPRLQNNLLSNMFYCGQLSTPGPGVPPSIISGLVVAELINKKFPH